MCARIRTQMSLRLSVAVPAGLCLPAGISIGTAVAVAVLSLSFPRRLRLSNPEPPDPIFPDGKRPWWAGRKCRKCKGKLFEVKEQKWGGFLVCQSCGHEQEFVTADMSIADSPITGQKPGEWEEL